ncbi:MAG: hypothetical protein HY951_15435 [Bacteroidia bacterium]|nr:hypothetical protein [Bacteroidia bacterium]
MKKNLFILTLISAAFFFSCSNSETNTESLTNDSTVVSSTPKTELKVTKQFVTNQDGTVQENAVAATISYNEKEVSVNFTDSVEKSFTVTVISLEKKVEGTTMKVTDGKYFEVFVSSGSQPQITFSSDRGYGNMTFM